MSGKYGFLYTSEKIPKLPHIDHRYVRQELSRAYPWMVWNTSVLEGYDFTLSEVESIINGSSVANHPIPHVDDLRGIAAGWRVALDAMDGNKPANEQLARSINHAITRGTSLAPGMFRCDPHDFGGDGGNVHTPRGGYTAPLPQDIRNLWDNFDEYDVVVRSFLRIPFITRLQPFWDGNKRTAVMLSAVDLINNGYPPLIVEAGSFDRWHIALTGLFIDDDADSLIECLSASVLKI